MGCPYARGSVSVSRVRSTASDPPRLSAQARTCARPGSAPSAVARAAVADAQPADAVLGPTSTRSGPSRPERAKPDGEQEQERLPQPCRAAGDANRIGREHLDEIEAAHEVQRPGCLDHLGGDLLRVRRAAVERLAGERAEHAGDLADLLPGLLRDAEAVGDRARRVRLRELDHPEQPEQRVVELVDNTGDDAAEREQPTRLGAIALVQVDSHTAYHRTDPSNEGRLSKGFGDS